eukprot:711933-Pyramimonas_sp.AAC.1
MPYRGEGLSGPSWAPQGLALELLAPSSNALGPPHVSPLVTSRGSPGTRQCAPRKTISNDCVKCSTAAGGSWSVLRPPGLVL